MFLCCSYQVINSIGITNSLLANRIDGCFVFHFRNGSIIPYFAIDVIQFGKTTDYSFDLTTALVNSGFSVPNGFLLSNRDNTRKLLVEFNSVAFLGKDKPYFMDHLHIDIKYHRKMKRLQNVFILPQLSTYQYF